MRFMRCMVPVISLSLSVLLAPNAALAADRAVCLSAVDKGQGLRDEGKLREAREAFLACSDRSCPSAVSTQCTQWLEESERDIPSIVFRVKDTAGKEALDAQVFLEGSDAAIPIQTKALPLNPGSYKIKATLRDGKSREETILLRKGERDRVIEIAFPIGLAAEAPVPAGAAAVVPSEPAAASSQGFKIPAYAWIGVGVGVLGAVGTGVFAASANSDQSALTESRCAPQCDASKRSDIEGKVTLANVSLIASGVGFGFAIVSTILANVGSKETPSAQGTPTAKRPTPRGLSSSLVVAPTLTGAVASWSGRF
jgi:hypothetical protein